jgi:hypothetical protein
MVNVPGDVKVLIVSPGLEVVSTVPPVATNGKEVAPPPFLRLPNPNPLPAEPAPIILVKIGLI